MAKHRSRRTKRAKTRKHRRTRSRRNMTLKLKKIVPKVEHKVENLGSNITDKIGQMFSSVKKLVRK